MPKVSVHEAALAVLAACLLFVVLFWRLGAPTFWDPDEAHYAETSREMITASDWSAPFYNEQPFFDKPVLFHQLQSTAMRLVADPETGARLVPALAALALVAITFWFGAVTVSRDVGAVAALMLAACPGVFGLARYAILDTLFTMFTFGGAALSGRGSAPGSAAPAVAGLRRDRARRADEGSARARPVRPDAADPDCASRADLRRRLLALHWMAGLAIVAAVSAPWFIYMYLRFRRLRQRLHPRRERPAVCRDPLRATSPGYGFYVQILCRRAAALDRPPRRAGWSTTPRAAARRTRSTAVEMMFWAWTVAIVGFFTLSTFKLDHYVFPAAPALCLLCARAWSDLRLEPDADASPLRAARVLSRSGRCCVVLGVGVRLLSRRARSRCRAARSSSRSR